MLNVSGPGKIVRYPDPKIFKCSDAFQRMTRYAQTKAGTVPAVLITGLVQCCKSQEVCRLTEAHFVSSSCNSASSAWITNHQLFFFAEGLLVFFLIVRPSILHRRDIAFEMDFVVVCIVVPQTLRDLAQFVHLNQETDKAAAVTSSGH